MTNQLDVQRAVEGILFVTPDPIQRTKLYELFQNKEDEKVDRAIEALKKRYNSDPERVEDSEDNASGIMLDEVGGGVRLVTRPEIVSYLRRFFQVTGSTKLSMAALETLAIVAYRQPVTGPEVQELRTKNSAGVIKTLLEKRLIRISGRREVIGKPFEYSTTRDFLLHFGLKSLSDLPPLEEFEEAMGADGDFSGLSDGEYVPDREEEILLEVARVEEAESEHDAEDPTPEALDLVETEA